MAKHAILELPLDGAREHDTFDVAADQLELLDVLEAARAGGSAVFSPAVSSLDERVIAAVDGHPSVRSVQLVGSRAEGRATARSDWDFLVDAADFPAVAADLGELCVPLDPIGQQWDRLSSHHCWMLMLRGPTKVDLIFPDRPHQREPPWKPSPENLAAIDLHFWDWSLWLDSKEAAGKDDLVAAELGKLFQHLLSPLGVRKTPRSVPAAVAAYRAARAEAEERFALRVPRDVENEVVSALNF